MEPQNVLMTGTSSGFGFLTSKTLAARGHHVFAGMRNVDTKNKEAAEALRSFGADSPGSIDVLQMDVTSDEEVNAAVRRAEEIGGHLDVAINSAGYVTIGWQEEFSVEDFREIFDLFLFAAQRVYRAVLPRMRARKSGLVINVTTIGARIAQPLRQGPYAGAKWALEVLTERYRQELGHFNIESVTVQPGLFPGTNLPHNVRHINNKEIIDQYPSYQEDRYFKTYDRFFRSMGQKSEQGQEVADAIARLVEMPAGTRPPSTVVSSRNIFGCKEAEELNNLFHKTQEKLLALFVEGKPGDFFKDE